MNLENYFFMMKRREYLLFIVFSLKIGLLVKTNMS